MMRPVRVLILCILGGCALFAAKAARVDKKPAAKLKASPIVQKWMRSMTLRDKVAQLVMMPCYGEAINTRSAQYRQYMHFVRDLKVGGLIVLGHIINGTVRNAEPFAMAAFLNRMQRLAQVPLLIGADFERGASMRVNSTTSWPYNMAFGAARDVDAARFEGSFTVKEARALGVQWIFAPDADVNNNPDNPIINIRSYGENPEEVASFVRAYIEGAHSDPKKSALVTAKHFPGHGDTAVDSHMGLPRLEADRERLNTVELVPFRAAIAAKVDAIMTVHMAVPALEPDNIPATVSSKVLTGLLRNELGFQGVIVTDAMDMRGLTQAFGAGEASVRALEAGADCLLMPVKAEDAIHAVVAAVASGRLTKQRIDESLIRLLSAKVHVGLPQLKLVNVEEVSDVIQSPEADERAQSVADKAVTLVRNDGNIFPPTNPDSTCVVALPESRYSQQGRKLMEEIRRRSTKMTVTVLDPAMSKADLDQIAQSTSACSAVVIAAYATVGAYRGNVVLPGDYTTLVNTLISGPVPVTLMSLGNPYVVRSFANVKAYVATYSPTTTSETAAVKAMFGEIPIAGHLPVTIPDIAKYGDGIQLPATRPALAAPAARIPETHRNQKGS